MMTLHFIRPLWLLAFIPVMFYLLWIMTSSRQTNPWKRICDPHLLPALIQKSKHTSQRIYYCVLFLLLSLIILSLAGPAWNKTKVPVYRDLTSLMLILDLSPTMLNTDLTPDRLSRAKFKIRDLIKLSRNTQMGLVVFSAEAFVVAPLSEDANTLNGLLEELHPQMMPVMGSDMGQGLKQALQLIRQTTIPNGDLLLITASEPTTAAWEAAKAIRETGNQLNILAMFTINANNRHIFEALQQLAKIGGGNLYSFSPDTADIQQILENYHANLIVKDQNLAEANLWQDMGPWICLLLVPLALLVLREKIS